MPNGVDNTFPKTCCLGDDCCDPAGSESWNDNTFPPQCCEPGTKLGPFPSSLPDAFFADLV